MREKLLDLMKNEGLKPGRLAELLEVNPAGISHILAGRNKPGFDLLQKILRRFPQISPDWLLLDTGPMYREQDTASVAASLLSGGQPNRQPSSPSIDEGLFARQSRPSGSGNPLSPTGAQSAQGNGTLPTGPESFGTSLLRTGVKVSRVVIFYEDQTFEAYTPTNSGADTRK